MIKADYDKNERIYDLLTQDSFFILNRKLNSCIGLILSAFLVFLLDKEKYHKYNNELTKDGFFYATDMDIMLMTGLTSSQVSKLKKEAEEKEFVSVKKEGIPLKTYYKVNLQKINDILNLNKSAIELSYQRITEEDIPNLLNVSENILINLSFRDLRFICKKFRVKYYGTNTKQQMIENILEAKEKMASGETETEDKQNKKVSNEVLSIQDLRNLTFKNLRSICKENNITYTGQDTKSILVNKIADFKGFIELEADEELTKPEISSVAETENIDIDFKKIFDDFDIAYTFKNQEAIKKLRKSMSDKDIKDYLTETYNNIKATPGVKNIGALFTAKIFKGERQILTVKKETKQIANKNINEDINNEAIKTFDFETKENSEILMEKFKNLPKEQKTILEEKAINLCCEQEKITSSHLYQLKKSNAMIYENTLKPFLLKILETDLKEAS